MFVVGVCVFVVGVCMCVFDHVLVAGNASMMDFVIVYDYCRLNS